MSLAGRAVSLAPLTTAPSQSYYDMEVDALQRDWLDMKRDMEASAAQAAHTNAEKCQRQVASWEAKIEARRTSIKALAASFQAEEDAAMAQYQADTCELERLNQHEISRLRQRVPRPQRPPRLAPAPRPHRSEATRMCKRQPPTPASLGRAQDILTWLHTSGIQQRHAQGQPFIEALFRVSGTGPLWGASQQELLALHLELSALPAAAWSSAAATIARMLDASILVPRAPKAGALETRVGPASPTWFNRLKGWLPLGPIGWSKMAAQLWRTDIKG